MSEPPSHNLDQLMATIQDVGSPLEGRLEAIQKLGMQLGSLSDPRGLICLLDALKTDDHPEIVTRCIDVLGRGHAVSAVMTFVDVALAHGIHLYDNDASADFKGTDACIRLRTAAVRTLGRMGDDRAIVPLMSILNNRGENYRLRLAAAESLGRLGDENAIHSLLEIVRDEREKSTYLKESAVKALGMLGDIRAMETLIDEMESQKGFWNKFKFMKEQLFEAIGRIGSQTPKIYESLHNALQDEAPSIRLAAVEALGTTGGTSGDAASLEALQKMVFDPSDEVALAAIEAIHAIGGEDALQGLLTLDNIPRLLRNAIHDYFIEDLED